MLKVAIEMALTFISNTVLDQGMVKFDNRNCPYLDEAVGTYEYIDCNYLSWHFPKRALRNADNFRIFGQVCR